MRKILVSCASLLLCLSMMASSLDNRIIIRKKPVPTPTFPAPPSTPLSADEPEFSAIINNQSVTLTSETATGYVFVRVVDEWGTVWATTDAFMDAGAELLIDISALPTGAYLLEIEFDDIAYVGTFNL